MLSMMDPAFLNPLPNELKMKVKSIMLKHPETGTIFQELIEQLSTVNDSTLTHKKPKVVDEEIKEIGELKIKFAELSFQSPIRKKSNLQLHEFGLSLSVNGSIEFRLLYSEIQNMLCLPSPNKGKAHFTWVLIPDDDGEDCTLPANTVLFSFDDLIPKFNLESKMELDESAYEGGVNDLISAAISSLITNVDISIPKPHIFASSDTIGYNQKPVPYVNCYDRAKEGFMYFFDFGLFFGFKKPLMFYPSEDIEKLEITSITGRFFNLHIILNGMEKGDFMEYSMFAAAELKGVSDYIGKYGKQNKEPKKVKEVCNPSAMPTSIIAAPLASDDDDDDFALDPASEGGIAEEYDSDHETDSDSSSVAIESQSGEEDQEDQEEDEEEDQEEEVVVFKSSEVSKAQAHIKDIEKQRKQMKKSAPTTIVAVGKDNEDDEEEEDLGDSSDADSRDVEEEDYETDSEEEDDIIEELSGEEIIVVEQSGQTEMEDELA